MKKLIITTLLGLLATSSLCAQSLIDELKPFEPFVGKTYRGEFANSTPEKPVIDISRWERHLNGRAVRIEHSINHGEYGGETIIFWDTATKKIRYFYFTTAGFYTEAEVYFEGNTMISRERVSGNTNQISEVKAKATLNKDGTMSVESEYLKQGEWVTGHSTTYVPDETTEVIFK